MNYLESEKELDSEILNQKCEEIEKFEINNLFSNIDDKMEILLGDNLDLTFFIENKPNYDLELLEIKKEQIEHEKKTEMANMRSQELYDFF
jgi:hypothetical protein